MAFFLVRCKLVGAAFNNNSNNNNGRARAENEKCESKRNCIRATAGGDIIIKLIEMCVLENEILKIAKTRVMFH